MVEGGELSAGHGRALLAFADDDLRLEWAQRVVATGLSVRALEKAASEAREPGSKKSVTSKERRARDPNLRSAEEKLALRLGAQVEIRQRRRGGSIVISCSDHEELMRVYEFLMGGE